MRKIIACILTIIYLGFTAGAVCYARPAEISYSSNTESSYRDNITASANKECPNSSSHFEDVNFHKLHKHLAASRTFEVHRVNFTALSSIVHISLINAAYKKVAAITVTPVLSPAPIFIKNCVLRI